MAYTGAWKRSANYYYDPDTGVVHTADPAHGVTNAPDPVAYVYTAPLGLDYSDDGPLSEYVGTEWVSDAAGLELDTTPRSHSGGDSPQLFHDDGAMLADAGARHGVDFGASKAGNYARPDTRASGETFDHSWFEIPADTTIDPVALQRGLNGLAQNNPEGFRAGHNELFRPNRRFLIGERRHDHRPLQVNTATTGSDTPPVDSPHGNPFSGWARAIQTVNARPTIRREPQPVSQAITSDDAAAGAFSDWVVG